MCPAESAPPFTCPRCGHQDPAFHAICPECGRPFQRDYIDVRVYPRDPDLTGLCTSRFWARIFLLVIAAGAAIGFLTWLLSWISP
jgi:predicted amidophosphoribosyltransferase